jgi:hypothetical protein
MVRPSFWTYVLTKQCHAGTTSRLLQGVSLPKVLQGSLAFASPTSEGCGLPRTHDLTRHLLCNAGYASYVVRASIDAWEAPRCAMPSMAKLLEIPHALTLQETNLGTPSQQRQEAMRQECRTITLASVAGGVHDPLRGVHEPHNALWSTPHPFPYSSLLKT